MKKIILLTAIIILSCNAEKKASKYYDAHKDKLAEKCATNFPVHDSIVVNDSTHFDTLYLEQEPLILRDSFYIKGDTIVKQVTKQCPSSQTIVKTVFRDTTRYIENTAKVVALTNQLNKATATVTTLKESNSTKNKWIWKLIIVVIIETLILFRKPILSILKL